MRTNVNISPDARQFVEYFAYANGITLGDALTKIVRDHKTLLEAKSIAPWTINEFGFPVLPKTDHVITTEMVRAELEDFI